MRTMTAAAASAQQQQRSSFTTILCIVAVLSITSCLMQFAFAQQQQQSASSRCHMRELDVCLAGLVTLVQRPGGGLALDESDINRQCVQLRDADTCVKTYARACMTPVQRELLFLAANATVTPLLFDYCPLNTNTNANSRSTNNNNTNRFRATYLKHAKCFSAVQRSGAHKACLRDLHAPLEQITAPIIVTQANASATPTGGRRVQVGCCALRQFEACVGQLIEKRCGKEAQAFASQTFRRLSSRVADVVCTSDKYKVNSKECKPVAQLRSSQQALSGSGGTSSSVIMRLLSAALSL